MNGETVVTLIIQVQTNIKRNSFAVTECYQTRMEFPAVKRRKVEVNFAGGEVTSDGGMLLLRQVDRQIGLTKALEFSVDRPSRSRTMRSQPTQHAAATDLRDGRGT